MKTFCLIACAAIFGLAGCTTAPTAAVAPAGACASPGSGPSSAVAASDAPRRRIFLMRHGEANYFDANGQRLADPDVAILTARGHEQARAAAQWFCAMGVRNFDRVITSDLPRAQQTARDLLDTMGLQGIQPQSWPEFREMKAGGREALARMSPAERDHAATAYDQAQVAADERLQGGESVAEARARIVPALDKLRGEQWDTALIVVHSMVNLVILSEALTGSDVLYGHLKQGTGCINILDVGPDAGEWVVKAVNVCPDPSNYWSRK
jgi:probable phosphoglycerate mutase